MPTRPSGPSLASTATLRLVFRGRSERSGPARVAAVLSAAARLWEVWCHVRAGALGDGKSIVESTFLWGSATPCEHSTFHSSCPLTRTTSRCIHASVVHSGGYWLTRGCILVFCFGSSTFDDVQDSRSQGDCIVHMGSGWPHSESTALL